MEYHSGGSLPLLGRPRYCPGTSANGGYLCETGHCCGETGCCTYYYELWWFWLLWTVLILFSCCCAYRHRRAKLRVQQQQRQREISLLAYHGASSYPSSMLDLSFLASLKLPSYEEVAAQPSTPPPPYSSVFTTPRYPQPPRAADPHLLTQHGPLLHRPLSDGPSSLSSDNSSSCSCDSCCPSSPCSSSLSAPITYETDTSHATTPSEATPLTFDVTLETIAAAASCLEVNGSRYVSERMTASMSVDVGDEDAATALEPVSTDSPVPNGTIVTKAVSPLPLASPGSEVTPPVQPASPIQQQLNTVPSPLTISTCSPSSLPSPSVVDSTIPSVQISIQGPADCPETSPVTSAPLVSNSDHTTTTHTLDPSRTHDTADIPTSPISMPSQDAERTLALLTDSDAPPTPDPNPNLMLILAPSNLPAPVPLSSTHTQQSIPVPSNFTQMSVPLPSSLNLPLTPVPSNHTLPQTPVSLNHTLPQTPVPSNHTLLPTLVPSNHTQLSTPHPLDDIQSSTPVSQNYTQPKTPVTSNPTQPSTPVLPDLTQDSKLEVTNLPQTPEPGPSNLSLAADAAPTSPTLACFQTPELSSRSGLVVDSSGLSSDVPQLAESSSVLVCPLEPVPVPAGSGSSPLLHSTPLIESDPVSPIPSNIQALFSSTSGSGSGFSSSPAPAASTSSCPAMNIEAGCSFVFSVSPPAILSPSSPSSIPSPASIPSPPTPSSISLPAAALLLDPLAALHPSNKGGSSSGHASSLSPSPRATQSPPKQTLFSPCVDVFEPVPPSWEDGEDEPDEEDNVDDDDEDMGADESQYRHRRLTGDSGIEVCRCRVEEEEEEQDEEEGTKEDVGIEGGERYKKGDGTSDLHDSVDCPARSQVTTGEGLTLCNSTSTTAPTPEDSGKVVIVMEMV